MKAKKKAQILRNRRTIAMLCLLAMLNSTLPFVNGTWAWFTDNSRSGVDAIQSAEFAVTVEVTASTGTLTEQDYANYTITGGGYTGEVTSQKDVYTLDAGRSFEVTLTPTGTASTGYCTISGLDSQINPISFTKDSATSDWNPVTFTITVTGNSDAKIKFAYQWGASNTAAAVAYSIFDPLTIEDGGSYNEYGEPITLTFADYIRPTYDAMGMPWYYQNDYPNLGYGDSNVAREGCGIVSLAMVGTYLSGHEYYPEQLAGWFGGLGTSNVERLEYGIKALGLPVQSVANLDELVAVMTGTTVAEETATVPDETTEAIIEEPTEAPETAETEEPTEESEIAETEEPTEAPEPTETEEPTEAPEIAETEEPTEESEPTETGEPAEESEPTASEETGETTEETEVIVEQTGYTVSAAAAASAVSEEDGSTAEPQEDEEETGDTAPAVSAPPAEEPAVSFGDTNGKVAIILVNSNSPFTDDGHFLVVKDITEDGLFLLNDPNRDNYSKENLADGFENGFTRDMIAVGYQSAWVFDPAEMESGFVYSQDENTITLGAHDLPVYYQNDYPDQRYGNGTVATDGCGITALAMVASYMTPYDYAPDELARYFGGTAENNIQRMLNGAEALQLPYEQAENIDEAMSALRQGKIVIELVDYNNTLTTTQHFVIWRGLTAQGRILISDPNRDNYQRQELSYQFENGFLKSELMEGWQGAWIFDPDAVADDICYYYEENDLDYDNPNYDVDLTYEEQLLIAKVIYAESRGEPAEGQQAVAEVVLNRYISGGFGDSIYGVVYSEGAFNSVTLGYVDIETNVPGQAQYDALERALYGTNILPKDIYYFATESTAPDDYHCQIENHYFW